MRRSTASLTRWLPFLGILLLAGCDTERAPERADGSTSPLSEARREALCADLRNQYECASLVETHLLQRGAPGVTRTGDTLTIRLIGGGTRTLVDHGRQADVVYYTYVGRLESIGQHLVQIHYYEGDAHLLVDAATGEDVRVAGPPAVSPDGQRIAVASYGGVAGYSPDLIRIRRAGDDFPVEWEHTGEWGAGSPRWIDSATVRFTRLWVCDSRTCEEEAVLRRADGEWSLATDGSGDG